MATDPTEPQIAARVISSFSRLALTMRASDSRTVGSGESIVGKCPSLNRRATLSSTTTRERP